MALGSAGIIPFYSGMRIVGMYRLMELPLLQGRRTGGATFTRTHATYVLSKSRPHPALRHMESARGMQLEATPYSRDMLSKPEFEAAYAVMREQCRRAACTRAEDGAL